MQVPRPSAYSHKISYYLLSLADNLYMENAYHLAFIWLKCNTLLYIKEDTDAWQKEYK